MGLMPYELYVNPLLARASMSFVQALASPLLEVWLVVVARMLWVEVL